LASESRISSFVLFLPFLSFCISSSSSSSFVMAYSNNMPPKTKTKQTTNNQQDTTTLMNTNEHYQTEHYKYADAAPQPFELTLRCRAAQQPFKWCLRFLWSLAESTGNWSCSEQFCNNTSTIHLFLSHPRNTTKFSLKPFIAATNRLSLALGLRRAVARGAR
jgi:hypothetical protein